MQKKENKKYKKKQQRYAQKISTLNIDFEKIKKQTQFIGHELWAIISGLIEPQWTGYHNPRKLA